MIPSASAACYSRWCFGTIFEILPFIVARVADELSNPLDSPSYFSFCNKVSGANGVTFIMTFVKTEGLLEYKLTAIRLAHYVYKLNNKILSLHLILTLA